MSNYNNIYVYRVIDNDIKTKVVFETRDISIAINIFYVALLNKINLLKKYDKQLDSTNNMYITKSYKHSPVQVYDIYELNSNYQLVSIYTGEVQSCQLSPMIQYELFNTRLINLDTKGAKQPLRSDSNNDTTIVKQSITYIRDDKTKKQFKIFEPIANVVDVDDIDIVDKKNNKQQVTNDKIKEINESDKYKQQLEALKDIKKEINTTLDINKKLDEERLKRQQEERENLFYSDIDTYYRIKNDYENNILNEIPELFTDKYVILSILEEDGYLQPTKACYKKFTDMYYDEEYEEKQTKGLEYVKSLIN